MGRDSALTVRARGYGFNSATPAAPFFWKGARRVIHKTGGIIDAVSDCMKRGFTHDYRIMSGQSKNLKAGRSVAADALGTDAPPRFERSPDAANGTDIYSILESDTLGEGQLIDAFDFLGENARGVARTFLSETLHLLRSRTKESRSEPLAKGAE